MDKETTWLIRKASVDEYQAVRKFYHDLIDRMQDAQYGPGWEKEVYPSDAYLKESLEKQELFVGIQDGQIIAAMIINHSCNESYKKVQFSTTFAENEVMVIHALGVLPDFGRNGYGKKLVEKAVSYAKEYEQKALRLDVLGGNLPAEKLYTGIGFRYISTIPMFYEDTGWTEYKVYEYLL